MDNHEVTAKIVNFLRSIGLEIELCPLDDPTFLPGLTFKNGKILVDTGKLLYPGDILHEAGHLATLAPAERENANAALPKDGNDPQASEMMAQAWSYAACLAIGIDPHIVFHENGYHGSSKHLVEIYSSDVPPVVPTLQWLGMTRDKKNAEKLNTLAYPHMICWLRQA